MKNLSSLTLRRLAAVIHITFFPQLSILLLTITLTTITLTLSGCGLFAASGENQGPIAIRTVYPTFTPTSAVTPTPVPQTTAPAQQANSAPAPLNPPQSGARAVINGPLVNARTGPGTDFEIIAEVTRGEEFDIVGVSADGGWWQICCVEGVQAWVTSEFVDTLGATDSVRVIGGEAQAALPEAPTEAAAPVTPAAAPAPVANFALETQEQFPETALVRIFLYVYAGNSALEGYSLRVTKDGSPLPVEGSSFGGQPAFTWPFQDPRQRFQNFKAEFPNTPAQGVWQVQLIDSAGATVGPPATFTLNANDAQQELYVRYAQR